MTEKYAPSQDLINQAHINSEQYEKMYQESINKPDDFGLKMEKELIG